MPKTLGVLHHAKVYDSLSLDSAFHGLVEPRCKYLELPMKLTDKMLVLSDKEVHKQCPVGSFIKFQGNPYCHKQNSTANFLILVRRGSIDYKISVRDFRLELLKLKEVLK